MPQPKTQRPYQERFLDHFDRSQLRREVEAVPRRRFAGMNRHHLGAGCVAGHWRDRHSAGDDPEG